MVRVVAHQRWQIKRDGKAHSAVCQEILVALVGLFRTGKTRELAHRPKLAAIASGVNAARVRRMSWIVEVLLVSPIFRKIGMRVEPANRDARDRRKSGMPILI